MSNYLKLIVWFFMVILILSGGILFYSAKHNSNLISPVLGVSTISLADNLWQPRLTGVNTPAKLPANLTAEAAYFVDAQTGQVLFEKNAKEKLLIASLTKVMTVIVALDNQFANNLSRKYLVSENAANVEPDKMYLKPGEKLTTEELLQGIFLVSANDAAEVLAEGTTGRREEFINLMNSKAAQIGMNDTKFVNPTGLEEDGQTYYSTAYDVALMARYAIKRWPNLINISSQPHIFIPQTEDHQDYDLYSGINLLTSYPGVIGFKTGYTPEAGLTLITLANRQGKTVIGVLLGAVDRRDDAKELLDYSFESLGVN